jgi:intraflagellar transport protein 122
MRSKPFKDKEELVPICYRCSVSNPPLNPQGDRCVNCGHEFVRSYLHFEPLPLVSFVLEEGISHEEAARLIAALPPEPAAAPQRPAEDPNVQTLRIDDGDAGGAEAKARDPFMEQLLGSEADVVGGIQPIRLDRAGLLACPPEHTFIVRVPGADPELVAPCYYRLAVAGIGVAQCRACSHLFHQEDFEFHVLQKRACPFCRAPQGDAAQ